ncbi:hypothetical protein F5B18DRAFT_644634 [Nemania serpens]|nr:hypothetical protein F5B18DRAFT_644634 [Nemania serpens]
MSPMHCPRCLEIFSAFKDFDAHLRQDERCEERSGRVEGITEAIKEKLSRRADQSVNEAEREPDLRQNASAFCPYAFVFLTYLSFKNHAVLFLYL